MTIHNWQNKDNDEILFQSNGFYWKIDSLVADEYVNAIGPLCIKKSCLFQLVTFNKDETIYYFCDKCKSEYEIEKDVNYLNEFATRSFIAHRRKGLKAINLDKLPVINEELNENDKYYRVSIERKNEDMKDIHIIVGRRTNNGKKAHIIISEDGEIRIDKKDLHPSEEIKSITSIIYK